MTCGLDLILAHCCVDFAHFFLSASTIRIMTRHIAARSSTDPLNMYTYSYIPVASNINPVKKTKIIFFYYILSPQLIQLNVLIIHANKVCWSFLFDFFWDMKILRLHLCSQKIHKLRIFNFKLWRVGWDRTNLCSYVIHVPCSV